MYNNIKKYNEFIKENKVNAYAKANMLLLSDIDMSKDDKSMMIQIMEKLYSNLSPKNKKEVNSFLEKSEVKLSDIINENFWDKLTGRVDKAAEVSDVLPDESEGILKKLLKKAGQAMNFIGKLLKAVKEWLSNIITDVKEKVAGKLNGDSKFVSAVKKVANEDENAFVKDLKTSKTVYSFYKKDLLGNILGNMKKGLGNFFSNEQKPIPESFEYVTNEGKNVLSTFIHGIEKIPPFSWLHKVASLGEKGTGKIIEGLSFVTNKLGGPKFVLPTIAVLIGVAFEYKIKGTIKSGILSVLGDAFTGGFLSVISWIATFIAAVIAIDQVAGGKIIGAGDH